MPEVRTAGEGAGGTFGMSRCRLPRAARTIFLQI